MAEAAGLRFSVVIPAYNEARVIERTIVDLAAALDADGFDYEILVSDDGSTDDTRQVVAGLERRFPRLRHVVNPGPHGYGCAVRHGLGHFTGDAVVIAMADGSDAPRDVVTYFRRIEAGFDCAFGSRFDGDARVSGYPPVKRALNRLANAGIGWLLGSPYRDFTNGFKCYRRWVIEAMQPLVSGQFNLTVEMAMKAVESGARYAVVPNDWVQRSDGESKFRLVRMGCLYLLTIAYCWIGARLRRAVARR